MAGSKPGSIAQLANDFLPRKSIVAIENKNLPEDYKDRLLLSAVIGLIARRKVKDQNTVVENKCAPCVYLNKTALGSRVAYYMTTDVQLALLEHAVMVTTNYHELLLSKKSCYLVFGWCSVFRYWG